MQGPLRPAALDWSSPMSELPDDTPPPAPCRTPRSGRRQRFVMPDDQHDERVGEVIEAFLDGPPPKARRRVRQAPRPARLRPTSLRPVPLDTRPDWDVALRHEDARDGPLRSAGERRRRSAFALTPPGSADRIAARVGEIVRFHARETDRVARAAADRFHVLLPETEEAEAETLIERVRSACADQVAGRLGADLRVVGAAASPAHGRDAPRRPGRGSGRCRRRVGVGAASFLGAVAFDRGLSERASRRGAPIPRPGPRSDPVWTSDGWMIVLAGDTSQWNRSALESRAIGPPRGSPRGDAVDRLEMRQDRRHVRVGRDRRSRASSSDVRAPTEPSEPAQQDDADVDAPRRARRRGRRG